MASLLRRWSPQRVWPHSPTAAGSSLKTVGDASVETQSLPIVLGTFGGIGLLMGSAGLWILRRRRDPAVGDPAQGGLDESFLALLFVTSLTGLALLVLRDQPAMGPLLIVHLGTVLALFVTLLYGTFVHGVYRIAALLASSAESAADAAVSGEPP